MVSKYFLPPIPRPAPTLPHSCVELLLGPHAIVAGKHETQPWLRWLCSVQLALWPSAGTMPTQDAEEDSRLQMDRIRAQLVGAFGEQLEMRRSLVELENASVELHVDASRHLLAIAE